MKPLNACFTQFRLIQLFFIYISSLFPLLPRSLSTNLYHYHISTTVVTTYVSDWHYVLEVQNRERHNYVGILLEASRGAGVQLCNCEGDRLWVRFALEHMIFLIFSFLPSGIQTKLGVEFRHSSRNSSRIHRRSEEKSVLIQCPICFKVSRW